MRGNKESGMYKFIGFLKLYLFITVFLFAGVIANTNAQAISLTVTGVNPDGSETNVSSYRWVLEEDTTHPVTPGDVVADSLAVSIHNGYAPVMASGDQATPLPALDPAKRYFLSILPDAGYTMGGVQVTEADPNVTVRVNAEPLPSAQISVFVFEDNKAISGIPDIPAERGLPNFTIQIFDAGGQMMTDVFGNSLEGIVTDANGRALIKNLAPGKYDVAAVPNDGQPWVQTVTVGGTPLLTTRVKAGEPPFFTQAGILNMHVFIGFVQPFRDNALLPTTGTGSITGRVVNAHSSRPPNAQLFPGNSVKDCYVGLNLVEAGTETGVVAQACNPDSTFILSNVPAGTYQLVMWDEHLDNLMSVRTVTVGTDELAMGDIPIARWLGTLQGSVFRDDNEDGLRQDNEPGIPNQAVNLRFRDGSMFQAIVTDANGDYELSEIVPFGNKWLVAEVDFARFKATGVGAVVDKGGQLGTLPIFPGGEVNTPSPVFADPGLVLTEGMIVHADQVNVINWGKTAYGKGENGGISGIVYYATTRAEDDPTLAAGEDWEPGVPRVQVNLYADADNDRIIDDLNRDGIQTLADVDNYPFGWSDDTADRGPEDIDRNDPDHTLVSDADAVFNPGDAIQISYTDSFDDNLPTECIGLPQTVHGEVIQDCAETVQTWNQVRPAVFDGGYAFLTYFPGGIDSGSLESVLPDGMYIVEAVPPPGYEIVKEEDRNIDFGDDFLPTLTAALALPAFPTCVGDDHQVPNEFSLFPLFDDTGAAVAPYRAGELTPLCDRKQVPLNPGQNAAANFHIFTPVPKTGRIVGQILNPFANQADKNDPNFGGPLAPSWMPVSIQDFKGNEIVRVYSDEWGAYSALVPSTFSVHIPSPSGVSPHVVTICANSPSSDPNYNSNFDQPCLNMEVFPGKTSYVLTPVGAIAAFTGATSILDCEFPDGIPVIEEVNGLGGGPHIAAAGETLTIKSVGQTTGGMIEVPNYAYDGTNAEFITRDYGFGSDLGTVTIDGAAQIVTSWDQTQIQVTADRGGQLIVTRANGNASIMGVAVHIGGTVTRVPTDFSTIQAAIDSAAPGSLILVAPGTYNENLIMWKPVRLQGYGAHSTIIDAAGFAANAAKKADWLTLLNDKIEAGEVTLVDGQRADLALEQGAGITVLAKNASPALGGFGFDATGRPNARIDGFTVQGAAWGGGILVNGYARALEISNNLLEGNQGSFGGAIRIGWQSLVNPGSVLTSHPGYFSAFNDHISIHHNHVNQNGSLGNGGGLALFNGSDNYAVTDNYMCGNYTAVNGGAIAHFGLSDRGLIADNTLILNEAFGEGGAILIGGEFIPAGAPAGSLAPGAGSVTVASNLIQGNLVGDDGGGISIFSASGQDVLGAVADRYAFNILNNMIVNNASGFSAAGIALSDSINVNILHNTIAHNDSLATAAAFAGGGLTETTPMGAGIVSRGNSPGLASATLETFVNPILDNNIIWHNRSFLWRVDPATSLGEIVPNPMGPYWDLQVFGIPGASLNPRSSILSSLTDPHSTADYTGNNNTASDPSFVMPYYNTYQIVQGANALALFPKFEPLTLTGDYHIPSGSSAENAGDNALNNGFAYLVVDFDTGPRPTGVRADIGADEYVAAGGIGSVAPTIVSTSVTTAIAGQLYLYRVRAVDSNGDLLTYSFVGTPPAGLSIDPSTGVIQGVPSSSGPVTVRVRVSDGALSGDQTFTITVGGAVNQIPAAVDQSVRATKDIAIGITLLYTDLDGPGPYTFTIVSPPTSGTLGPVGVDGSATYTPDIGYTGTDSLTWRVNDGLADSNDATVTITVGAQAGVFVQCPGDVDGDAVPDPFLDPPANTVPNPDFDPAVKCMHITAGDGFATMADGKPLYIFSFADVTGLPQEQVMEAGMLAATWPAPTISVDQGDKVYLTLTNVGMMIRPDLFDPHTVHWHGFPNAASIFDGVPSASISINMGASLTYFYNVQEPGTFMYHCHVEATEHMQMGMLGNLYVRPQQNYLTAQIFPSGFVHTPWDEASQTGNRYAYNDGDGSTYYDVEVPIQIGSFDSFFHDASWNVQPLGFAYMEDNYPMLNGRGYPDTVNPNALPAPAENGGKISQAVSSLITATQGQKILLRISNLNVTRFNTLATTLGIPMKVVGKDAKLLRGPGGADLSYLTSSVTLGGGESVDVILDTTNVDPGTYLLYTTNFNFLSNNEEDFGGMMTEIVVNKPAK